MNTNMLKTFFVAFLTAVGIWAAIGFWQRHSIERRVRVAEETVRQAAIVTDEDGFSIVSATADRAGNVCLEYVSHNARRIDDIGYAVYEPAKPKFDSGWMWMRGTIDAVVRGAKILVF
jgi:hypothetical protein